MNASANRNVRKSAIAGTWYPGTSRELGDTVDRFVANVSPSPLAGRLLGLISPHAGYVYSGQVAAYAYRQLQGLEFDVVAVISPMHRTYVGPYVVNDAEFYETPLGLVEVDRALIDALAVYLPLTRVSWDDEHSLEIQLPFLQRVLPPFKLLPIMQGEQMLPACESLAAGLTKVLQGKNALLVASTDLSHFHPYKTATVLDRVVRDYIERYDPVGLARALQEGDAEACGGGPVVSVMLAAQALGAGKATVLNYANSGDVTGDLGRVVGYLSARHLPNWVTLESLPPMRFAEIVVSAPVLGRKPVAGASSPQHTSIWDTTFHYSIPAHLSQKVTLGQLVVVPFGAVERQGIILAFSETSPVAVTKEILAISDPQPALSLPQIELARWISRNYLAALPQAVLLMLPPGLVRRLQASLEPGQSAPASGVDGEERVLLRHLQKQGSLSVVTVKKRLGAAEGEATIRRWVRAGYVVRKQHLAAPRARPKVETMVQLTADTAALTRERLRLGHRSAQADVLRTLLESDDPLPTPAWVMQAAGCAAGPLGELQKRGFIARTLAQEWVRLPRQSPGQVDDAPPYWDAVHALLMEHPEGLEAGDLRRGAGLETKMLRVLEGRELIERVRQEAAVLLTATQDATVEEVVRLHGAEKQLAVLRFLQDEGEPVWIGWIYAQTGATLSTLRDLEEHGLIQFQEEEIVRNPLAGKKFAPFARPQLTADQEQVWGIIRKALVRPSGPDKPFLLHGVTGSGKTEIYLRALEQVLAQGRGAIVLVPEIALTPQTIQRFAGRFPNQIAVHHSDLSVGERFDLWRQVRARKLPVVIGTRSALFAPVPNLGLIIIDEEHESSYKHGRVPQYHARDVAAELARLTGATLIMGSATPDVVTYMRAQRGEYELLQLPGRILWSCDDLRTKLRDSSRGRVDPSISARLTRLSAQGAATAVYSDLPPVTVVDMRQELKAGNRSIFSTALAACTREALAAREQVILFLNRRGTATFVMCRDCGTTVKCPRCDFSLTYHRSGARLQCHYCNGRFDIPVRCEHCGSERIRFFGLGTEKVADLAAEAFPGARILRWDRDVTADKGAHELILDRFTRREADILIGTQMIAKGLDVPLVTVVGVISADTALNLPDFRAGERTFQLLTQVAGRAGRSVLGGKVVIQTYSPEHYAIQAAAQHDYARFFCDETAFRNRLRYPPYTRLVRLLYANSDEGQCRRQAMALHQKLRDRIARLGLPDVDLIGPAPCFMARLNGKFRWHLLVRGRDPLTLLRDVSPLAGWQIDVDPLDVL